MDLRRQPRISPSRSWVCSLTTPASTSSSARDGTRRRVSERRWRRCLCCMRTSGLRQYASQIRHRSPTRAVEPAASPFIVQVRMKCRTGQSPAWCQIRQTMNYVGGAWQSYNGPVCELQKYIGNRCIPAAPWQTNICGRAGPQWHPTSFAVSWRRERSSSHTGPILGFGVPYFKTFFLKEPL